MEKRQNVKAFCPGDYKFFIEHQNNKRYYRVHVPDSYKETNPFPVVLNFHGGGGSAEGHQKTSKMNEKADSAGFIVVYPAGTRRDDNPNKPFKRFWNPGNGPRGPYYVSSDPISKIDDLGFVEKILDDLESKFEIGNFPEDCNPERPIPVILFHGTVDVCAPYYGGISQASSKEAAIDRDFISAEETVYFWLKKNNCPKTPKITYKKGEKVNLTRQISGR